MEDTRIECKYHVALGKDATEAFSAFVQDTTRTNGGTSKQRNFVVINNDWKSIKKMYADAVKKLVAVSAYLDNEVPANDFDRDVITEKLNEVPMPVWLPPDCNSKTSALKTLRQQIKDVRKLRDSCKANMAAKDIAHHLACEICDERLTNKEGCIDIDPRLKGTRKPKRFLFFGYY